MKEDIWRFSSIFLLCLLAGLITGQVAICLITGLVLYIFWQYRTLQQLLSWLQRRNENDPPEIAGIFDEICREIDYLKNRHKTRKKKLAGLLKRFQEATAALPDAVVILGEFDVIEWANENAINFLGINWPQDSGQRLVNLVRNPKLVEFLSKPQKGSVLQIDSPNKAGLKLEFRLAPYGDNQKLLVARDITSIQLSNQMRKDFIANASHELRSPLTVISGYLENLEDDIEDLDPARKPQISQMRKQTERMQRLVEDLLQLSSLETSANDEEREKVAVPELLTNIYQEAQTLSGVMQHIFYMECDANLWILGKQRELYSAFSNLIFNAVQHTHERGVIRIRWYSDEAGAHLEIIDNGQGIAAEHIPRLTERFYRVDKGRSRNKGGTGLGLAIVKHVLVRHGGKLHIESRENVGSNFRCDFPTKIIHRIPKETEESLSA